MPRWLHDLAPALAVAATAALWRWAPFPLAATAAVAAVAACLALGAWKADAGPRASWPILIVAALIAALRLPTIDAWPCETGCAGAGAYHRLLGGEATAWAVVSFLIVAVLALRHRRAPRAPAGDQARLWMLAGVGAYYLWLSARLGLRCPHCLAVHTATFAATAVAVRGRLAWRWRWTLAALAGLALHAAYHHQPLDDRVVPAPAAVAADPAAVERIDHNRRLGRDDAPRLLELGVDFQCPRCAELHGELLRAVGSEVAGGRLQVVTRHVLRRSEPASRPLARWALAAAALGPDQYRAYVMAMLGARADAGDAELRRRAAQLVDMEAVERAVRDQAAAIDAVIARDAERLRGLSASTTTPLVCLVDRASGRVLKAWQGSFLVEDVAAALGSTY